MDIEYRSSEHASLGIEVELSIVDAQTRELASAACEIIGTLGSTHPDGEHPRVKHELFQCTLEIITGVCDTVAEARADLEATLAETRSEAEARGLRLLCAGTHPFSHWSDQLVSPKPRYTELVERIQWPARRLAIYGIHYHVGVRAPEKAIAIANSLAAHLPVFLALSASSPYWHGLDSGMASCRTKIFESLPTAGLPPPLRDWAEFESLMETLVNADAVTSIREVWWDVRPHPDFGTVELRMCDGMPTLTEVAAVAALAQSLVHDLDRRLDRGEPLPGAREWVVRQNKWVAARHGVDAELIVDAAGTRRPARELVEALVERLTPSARDLGCADELDFVRSIAEHGPSYVRQRRVRAEGGSVIDVVDQLADELVTGSPTRGG